MKYSWRIQKIPTAEPLSGITVRVRKQSDGSTITTLTTDADGWISWQVDGGVEEFYLHVADVPGGDRYWKSTDAMTAGVIPLKELPAILRALGDGTVIAIAELPPLTVIPGCGPLVTLAGGPFPG